MQHATKISRSGSSCYLRPGAGGASCAFERLDKVLPDGAVGSPHTQNPQLDNSGLPTQLPVLNARAFEIAYRGRNQRETHPTRDQANHCLHLARMLGDSRCEAVRAAVTDGEVVEAGSNIARRDDEAFLRQHAQIHRTGSLDSRMP